MRAVMTMKKLDIAQWPAGPTRAALETQSWGIRTEFGEERYRGSESVLEMESLQ
jgi:hypothetical protein